jgi:hypothetical protein
MPLERNDLKWLAALARVRVRRMERTVAAFTPRPGQEPADAAATLAKFQRTLAWQRSVLDRIDAELRNRERSDQ